MRVGGDGVRYFVIGANCIAGDYDNGLLVDAEMMVGVASGAFFDGEIVKTMHVELDTDSNRKGTATCDGPDPSLLENPAIWSASTN